MQVIQNKDVQVAGSGEHVYTRVEALAVANRPSEA
jgi:hypothetical protein